MFAGTGNPVGVAAARPGINTIRTSTNLFSRDVNTKEVNGFYKQFDDQTRDTVLLFMREMDTDYFQELVEKFKSMGVKINNYIPLGALRGNTNVTYSIFGIDIEIDETLALHELFATEEQEDTDVLIDRYCKIVVLLTLLSLYFEQSSLGATLQGKNGDAIFSMIANGNESIHGYSLPLAFVKSYLQGGDDIVGKARIRQAQYTCVIMANLEIAFLSEGPEFFEQIKPNITKVHKDLTEIYLKVTGRAQTRIVRCINLYGNHAHARQEIKDKLAALPSGYETMCIKELQSLKEWPIIKVILGIQWFSTYSGNFNEGRGQSYKTDALAYNIYDSKAFN